MKICFIADATSRHTIRWAEWFARRGNKVTLINTGSKQFDLGEIPVFHLPDHINLTIVKWLPWTLLVRRFITEWQPDILHTFQVTGAGWLGAVSGFHPLVITAWGSDIYVFPKRSKLAAWSTKLVLNRADLITANSSDLCTQAIRYGAPLSKTLLIRSGVNLDIFHPAIQLSPWSNSIRMLGSPLILSPRSCRPIYNIHIIVQAFAVVKPLITGARLLLMEYNADHQYKKEIERLINNLELSSSIIWIKPLHTEKEIAGLYQAVDLSVSIPNSDSVPVSMLEAMACGVPVIASDLKSAKEWIVPDQNGILVDPNQREPVIAAILNLLSDSEKQSHFREYNLRLIESEANQDTWMEKAENLYKELMPVHR